MRLKDFIGCFIFCACLVLPCFAVNAAGVTNYSRQLYKCGLLGEK